LTPPASQHKINQTNKPRKDKMSNKKTPTQKYIDEALARFSEKI